MHIDRFFTPIDFGTGMARDVRRGLSAMPKSLPPKYFYDARGSDLFEEITRLPEYYQTRAEAQILTEYVEEIVKLSGADSLVELGSGSAEKTRLLLSGFRAVGGLRHYVPVDVSDSALVESVRSLNADYPGLEISGVVADFEQHLHLLPRTGTRMVTFLGGTIGNFVPAERAVFLTSVRAQMNDGDTLLLGTDLVKDPSRLVAAYDDSSGVTAEFNRNVLRVVNRELSAGFDPESFAHVAVWDPVQEWIEMRLRSGRRHTVAVDALNLEVDFADGEEMRTEISAKFTRDRVEDELAAAGLTLGSWWTDPAGDFALSLSTPMLHATRPLHATSDGPLGANR